MNVNVNVWWLCNIINNNNNVQRYVHRTHLHSNNITHYNRKHCCCNAYMWVGWHFLKSPMTIHVHTNTDNFHAIQMARISGIVVVLVLIVHHRKIKFSHNSNSGRNRCVWWVDMYMHGVQSQCIMSSVYYVGQHESSWGIGTGLNKNCVEMTTSKRRKHTRHQIYCDKIHEPSHTSDSWCVRWMFCISFYGKFATQNQTNRDNGFTLDARYTTVYVPRCLFQLANIIPE